MVNGQKAEHPRGRIGGSARGARVVGFVIWGIFTLALIPPFFAFGFQWWGIGLAELFLLIILARPWFMGVRVRESDLLVSTWWRRYRFDRSSVRWISDTRYSGLLNRGSSSKSDPLARWCRMIVVNIDGRVRNFPSTINTRVTSDSVTTRLRGELTTKQARSEPVVDE